MDDELHGRTKSPNFHYFIVKDLVSKYDQLKEAIRSERVQIIKKTSGWRDDKNFCTTLHMSSATSLRNNISSLSDLQQISNISNARLDHFAFMLMPKPQIKFCYICIFISYPWCDHWFSINFSAMRNQINSG